MHSPTLALLHPPVPITLKTTMKRVALIGSSGGGTATLGHTDPVAFLQVLDRQLSLIQARIEAALIVALDGGKGMDGADGRQSARLFEINHVKKEGWQPVTRGTLEKVNAICAERQRELVAPKIRDGTIDALICVSCHVGIFKDTLREAAWRGIPVTGSGGTSLAQMGALFGIRLVGNAGGSVATTTATKAVSYTHALAVAWRRNYEPWSASERELSQNMPSWTSVLNSCLPAFWGVCLLKRILSFAKNSTNLGAAEITDVIFTLENHTLPAVCTLLVASSLRRPDAMTSESLLAMSAIVASAGCNGSILAGLWAGFLVVTLSDRLLYACIFQNIPATMTSLVVGGGLGGVVACVILPAAAILRRFTDLLRFSLASMLYHRPLGMGVAFVLGCLSCYGSKVGKYHSIHLPLILIEMERGGASFLGAVDEMSLVLVCAGICAAMIMPLDRCEPTPSERFLCQRGVRINLIYGDFVEACYEFMNASWIINVGGYLASGMSCAWLVWHGFLSTGMAYLPWPAVLVVASDRYQPLLEASFLAFGISFLFTLFSRIFGAKNPSK